MIDPDVPLVVIQGPPSDVKEMKCEVCRKTEDHWAHKLAPYKGHAFRPHLKHRFYLRRVVPNYPGVTQVFDCYYCFDQCLNYIHRDPRTGARLPL